jgi:hypothetical protein
MMGAITIFRESNFIFSLVSLIAWGWCTFEETTKKNKMSKDEQESFYSQIKMNHLT